MSDIFKAKVNNQWVGIPSLTGERGPQGEPGPQGPAGVQVNADWNETDTSSKAYILHKPNLATVATSGSYADLSNKPTIPVQAQAIASGDTGYATGDQVYQVVGDVESLLLALRGNV